MNWNKIQDKLKKNLEVVQLELLLWQTKMKRELARFKTAKKEGGVVHLLVNLAVETRRALPRTLTYLSIVLAILVTVIGWILVCLS